MALPALWALVLVAWAVDSLLCVCVSSCARNPASFQRNAVAVAYCKQGSGLVKINGSPIELVEPEPLRIKTFEPILLLGQERFSGVDIRIRVKGGGYTAQIYGTMPVVLACAAPWMGGCFSSRSSVSASR